MKRPDPYRPNTAFADPARAKSAPGRVAFVLIAFELIFIFVGALIYSNMSVGYETTPFGTVISFAWFGIVLVLFHHLVLRIHHRGVWSMIGPLTQALADFRKSFVSCALFVIGFTLFTTLSSLSDVESIRNPILWAAMLPLALVAVLVQVSTEEILYRGYFQQQITALIDVPLLYIGFPSLIFGLAHYWNGYGVADGVIYAIWAMAIGVACADLTARTGNIGAAIGLHFANNLSATIVLAETDGPSSGLALFLFPFTDRSEFDYSFASLFSIWAAFDLIYWLLGVLIMWLAARIALRV